jgi:hypothetical protein
MEGPQKDAGMLHTHWSRFVFLILVVHIPVFENLVEVMGLIGGCFEALARNRPIRSKSKVSVLVL